MKYKGSSAPRWCSVNTAVSPPPCFSFCFLCCFGSRGSLTQRARLWFPISRCVLSALGGPAQPASSPQCGPDLAGVMAPHSLLSVLFHFWNCVFASCTVGGLFTVCTTREAPSRQRTCPFRTNEYTVIHFMPWF